MKTLIFTLLLNALALTAHGGLKESFSEVSRQKKGPFGLNYLQGSSERIVVTDGRTPKDFMFQAAFRNEAARLMAEQDGVFLGNLFTTNYYELMGEFVYGDAYGSHPLDHSALAAQSPRAIAKAALMVQHWVLEKHYVEQFPSSMLARSFKIRGIGGSEFEQVYAKHFFNFYLGAIDGDFQYLPAFLLVNESPIKSSKSLARARDLIAESYDYFLGIYGVNDSRVKALYKLRNSIHNQLSPNVINEIDAYLRDFPFYLADGHTSLPEIRKILVEYYSFGPNKLVAQADELNLAAIKLAAEGINSSGPTAGGLLALSRAGAEARTRIGDTSFVSFGNRADALALLADTSRYLNKELSRLSSVKGPQVAETAINAIYIEGFLIKDNWDYFRGESASADSAKLLADVIEVAGGATLEEAFSPSYKQWLSIEPKMNYFLDNTIKSSALNTAAALIEKLR